MESIHPKFDGHPKYCTQLCCTICNETKLYTYMDDKLCIFWLEGVLKSFFLKEVIFVNTLNGTKESS